MTIVFLFKKNVKDIRDSYLLKTTNTHLLEYLLFFSFILLTIFPFIR